MLSSGSGLNIWVRVLSPFDWCMRGGREGGREGSGGREDGGGGAFASLVTLEYL